MPEYMCLSNEFESVIAERTDALVQQWNTGEGTDVMRMYSKSAKMIDAHGKTVVQGEKGKQLGSKRIKDVLAREKFTELIEYLKITFEFANEHGRPPIQLKSQRMFDDGCCIYDVGKYTWKNMHNGRSAKTAIVTSANRISFIL